MNAIRVIFPYRRNGVWMFDDPSKSLEQEPFVCGVPEMIESLVADIPDAEKGFSCYFSDRPFPGFQLKLDWDHEESGGSWYKLGDQIGWLCPALFKYSSDAPAQIYVKAEQRQVVFDDTASK